MFTKKKKEEAFSDFMSDIRQTIQLYVNNLRVDLEKEISELKDSLTLLRAELRTSEEEDQIFLVNLKHGETEKVRAAYLAPSGQWIKFYSTDDLLVAVYPAEEVSKAIIAGGVLDD